MPFLIGHPQQPPVSVTFICCCKNNNPFPVLEHLDENISVWPPDVPAILYGGLTPDWRGPLPDLQTIMPPHTASSFAFGRLEPMPTLHLLYASYKCFSDPEVEGSQKRAENAIYQMVKSQSGRECINLLPLSLAAPLREAARTCQLSPPQDWPLAAYRAIGRNDLAASARDAPDMLFNDGYRTVKDYIVCSYFVVLINS
jgi:anaphase-promoting complex subunit 1